MKNEKYEFVKGDDLVTDKGDILRRIRAIRDIPEQGVMNGALGGYISGEWNLHTYDNSWIHSRGVVRNGARISQNAVVYAGEVAGKAQLRGNCQLRDGFVAGLAYINTPVILCHGARITDKSHFGYIIHPYFDNSRYVAWWRGASEGESVVSIVGFPDEWKHFIGTVDELERILIDSRPAMLNECWPVVDLIRRSIAKFTWDANEGDGYTGVLS